MIFVKEFMFKTTDKSVKKLSVISTKHNNIFSLEENIETQKTIMMI